MLIITDLDNTLYDWVTFYANSFEAMISELSNTLELDSESLYKEFRMIHQKYGNSERSYTIFDISSVLEVTSSMNKLEKLDYLKESLDAFNSTRDKFLKLYGSVYKTLEKLKNDGHTIVAHTEAMDVNALDRLEKLGVLDFFTRVYATSSEKVRHPMKTDELLKKHHSKIVSLSGNVKKPSVESVNLVLSTEKYSASEAVYIGDSLIKDIAIANRANITSVLASYGKVYSKELWEVLVKITHWTDEDVRREEALKLEFKNTKPTYIINEFGELIQIVSNKSKL
ncbi:HAD family hydrolase [Fusibacter sp. JL216-2]|uniref:HAD family hydrolase n=1 Tax=Fusibacter sp. JL216-2 TaxID=3071453 RepID=UPI003D330234